jgi:hypothetical protein
MNVGFRSVPKNDIHGKIYTVKCVSHLTLSNTAGFPVIIYGGGGGGGGTGDTEEKMVG